MGRLSKDVKQKVLNRRDDESDGNDDEDGLTAVSAANTNQNEFEISINGNFHLNSFYSFTSLHNNMKKEDWQIICVDSYLIKI